MKNNLRFCNNCKFIECPKFKQTLEQLKPIKGCKKHKFNKDFM